MPSAVVLKRQRLSSVARNVLVRNVVRIDPARLQTWERRRESNIALRAASTPIVKWLERGPILLFGELTLGLLMAKDCVSVSHAHAGLLVRGALERPVQEALRRRLARGNVFFDVGANIGFFTLLGARMTGPEGAVVAFEPAPEGAAAVRRHADLNQFANVTVIEAAAGDRAGRERFLIVGEASWSHLADRGPHRDTKREVDVDVVVLDELIEAGGIPPPDVVKIDVEGSEGAVLRGLARTIERHRPAIVCELHETNAEIAELMHGFGYRLENLSGPEPVELAGPVHVLGVPVEGRDGGDRVAGGAEGT
jgi:FkbM family methyltransferase